MEVGSEVKVHVIKSWNPQKCDMDLFVAGWVSLRVEWCIPMGCIHHMSNSLSLQLNQICGKIPANGKIQLFIYALYLPIYLPTYLCLSVCLSVCK